MAIEKIKISEVKSNSSNPRIIKDDKFKKLVKSLINFPEMSEVRPIVCNTDMVVLGGNMRLKAMKEAGWKEVPVEIVDWSEEQQKEFIVKDNVGFGEWDWELLANEWDSDDLNEWGLDVPMFGSELNDMDESDLDFTEEFDPMGVSKGQQRVVFIFDGPEEAESYCNSLKVSFKKHSMAWQVNMTTTEL